VSFEKPTENKKIRYLKKTKLFLIKNVLTIYLRKNINLNLINNLTNYIMEKMNIIKGIKNLKKTHFISYLFELIFISIFFLSFLDFFYFYYTINDIIIYKRKKSISQPNKKLFVQYNNTYFCLASSQYFYYIIIIIIVLFIYLILLYTFNKKIAIKPLQLNYITVFKFIQWRLIIGH
jgi:hypothetical protein